MTLQAAEPAFDLFESELSAIVSEALDDQVAVSLIIAALRQKADEVSQASKR